MNGKCAKCPKVLLVKDIELSCAVIKKSHPQHVKKRCGWYQGVAMSMLRSFEWFWCVAYLLGYSEWLCTDKKAYKNK